MKTLISISVWLSILVTCLGLTDRAAAAGTASTRVETVAEPWRNFKPAFEKRACWFGEIKDQSDADLVCGVVKVPEDRTNPKSGLISIAVMSIDADRHRSSSGPLVWLDSGPGRASISKGRAQSAIDGRFSRLRRATGIVFFDQRGTGQSDRDFCRSVPDAFTYGVRVEPEGEKIFSQNMRACLDKARASGIPVSAYSNWQIALDVRDIRKALMFEKWNVLGYLTSTGIAQAILQVDPAGVRSAILDSPGPPERGHSDAPSLAMDQTLRHLSGLCSAIADCRARNGNLHARVLNILDSYEQKPLIIDGLNPKAATGGRLVVDDRIAANFLMFMIYDSGNHGDLPAILDILEDRDRVAVRVYAEIWFQPPDGKGSQATRFAIKCRNESGGLGTPPETLAAAARQAPGIDRRLGLFRYADDCAALNYGGPDPSARLTKFAGPVLITDGALNPVQRPRWTKAMMSRFPAGQYVLFPHSGVMPLMSQFEGCGGEILGEFLATPGRPVTSKCVANDPAPDFLTSYRRTSKPGLMLMSIQSGKYPILPIALLFSVVAALFVMPIRWGIRRLRRASMAGGRVVPRPELIGWIAILFSVAALATFAITVMGWVEQHPVAVPAGLPSRVLGALAISILAGLLAALAIALTWRLRRDQSQISMLLVSLCVLCSFATLWWISAMV